MLFHLYGKYAANFLNCTDEFYVGQDRNVLNQVFLQLHGAPSSCFLINLQSVLFNLCGLRRAWMSKT